MSVSRFSPAPPLVLVSCGPPEAIAQRLPALAEDLASRLGWSLFPLGEGPDPQTLRSLQVAAGEVGGPLAILPVDPGRWMVGQGTWAEALGAWRQPVLVVLPSMEHRSGTAAALVALLRQEGVPLVGLLQLGGDWSAEDRRRDGLPWLGCWPDRAQPGGVAADDPSLWDQAEATLVCLGRALQGLGAGQ